MPRIDPLSLLKCLSVLLGPSGGIKSKEEVSRLANLMTKFSKKLVSKCIYIQILKNTEPVLLDLFMAHGGWNLIHMWLTDGILAKNWALIQELLELLLLCPVDTNRLKSNHCPKLIKGLSKEGSHEAIKVLASRLVEQWLKMVKGEAPPSTEAIQHTTMSSSTPVQSLQSNASITPVTSQSINSENAVTMHTSDSSVVQNTHTTHSFQELLKNTNPPKTPQINNLQTITSSVYKIIIRDGKQVLTQVQTDAANINNVMCVNNLKTEINGDVVDQVLPTEGSSKFISESEPSNQRISSISKNNVDSLSSEVVKDVVGLHNETDNVKSSNCKNEKDIGSDGNKSTSDKENRDKKDDKKSSSSSVDKKSSSYSQSSSKGSSKHSSSSSKHSSSSSKHSSSSHRSSSKSSSSSSSSKDKSSRDKDKDRHHSGSSSKSSSSKSKTDRDKEREREKEKQKKDQAERDKATLEKVQGQSLSFKIGKIPKKKSDEEKSEDSSKKSSTDLKESKESKDKKLAAIAEKKKISISIENRKNSQDSTSRPKTVKTFNSKFRSTGLEEEVVKPPPPRGSKKQTSVPDKKVVPPPKIPLKRSSPIKETGPLDKKAKLALDSPPIDEKKGGIKLIPAKPKLVFLQESDMFMDALTASTKSKEPRKRKRRASLTKDGASDTKKMENAQENHTSSPPISPTSPPNNANHKNTNDKSVVVEKPTFKFYQDTLETDDEKEDKIKSKADDDSAKDTNVDMEDSKKAKSEDVEDRDRSRTPTPENDFDDEKRSNSPEDPAAAVSEALSKEESLEARPIGGVLKSVLLLQKRKGPKKSLKWKTDLESIRYFELDETERVNVTKTSFTDMKQMEKMNEREAFQMARKLSSEDVMEEKTLWKPLIPIDTDPPLVEPGKDSREKDIQYAREKGILQALYFHRGMIPDSPAEPDEERHHIFIEPKIIPLDDLTGNKESEKDYSNTPWPEPKPQPPVITTSIPSPFFQTFRNNQPPILPPVGGQSQMNPMPPSLMNSMTSQMPPEMSNTLTPVASGGGGGGGGGGWRTGDGKIVVPDPNITPMPSMNTTYPQAMDGPPMAPPSMMGPPMFNQDGYPMPPEDMNFNNYQGPPGPNMFGPGPGGPPSSGLPFQGPRGPPMHGNRGRGGPGWFRGGPPRGMPWRGGWRGSGKQPPVCRQFKAGFCRVGDKCQFLHPGQNCPPF